MTTHAPASPIAVDVHIAGEKKKASAAAARSNAAASQHSLGGTIWFIGWLFTIGFAKLVWWKALLAVIAWPYFLGITVH